MRPNEQPMLPLSNNLRRKIFPQGVAKTSGTGQFGLGSIPAGTEVFKRQMPPQIGSLDVHAAIPHDCPAFTSQKILAGSKVIIEEIPLESKLP
jgi:hypothetical protein